MEENTTAEKLIDSSKRFMDVHEVAKYLGVSRWMIYKLIKNRQFPFISVSKQTLRFDRFKVEKWMEKQTVKAISECI
jgi:excisionase family DNA binding protein